MRMVATRPSRRPSTAAPALTGAAATPRRAAAPSWRPRLAVLAAVTARWNLDVKYGCKQEATLLLQEWVRDVGYAAGLRPTNTRISSGAIGVPESRLEVRLVENRQKDSRQHDTAVG